MIMLWWIMLILLGIWLLNKFIIMPFRYRNIHFEQNACFLIIGVSKGLGFEIVNQLSNYGKMMKFILIDILPCNSLCILWL